MGFKKLLFQKNCEGIVYGETGADRFPLKHFVWCTHLLGYTRRFEWYSALLHYQSNCCFSNSSGVNSNCIFRQQIQC